MTIFRTNILFSVLTTAVILSNNVAAENFRPPLDKTEIRGKVMIHANPWFLPNKHRVDAIGGPDISMHRYISGPNTSQALWCQIAKELKEYGIDGIQYEGNLEYPGVSLYKPILDGFAESNTGLVVSYFVVAFGNAQQLEAHALHFFREVKVLEDHPNLWKIDGKPVVQLYGLNKNLSQDEWKKIVAHVEAETGPKVWLLEMMDGTPEQVRKFMPVMDGLFMYGNWNESNQQEIFSQMAPIMHKEFPEKIFMPAVQNVYTNHFLYSGVAPRLLDKYLRSWETTLAAQPDAITLTNLFDHYEHSLHLPSYNWENLLFRITENKISAWRGKPQPATAVPELFILNTANVVVGQKMYFDVISFPTNSAVPVDCRLELVSVSGKQLHDFGKFSLATNKMDIVRFELDSLPFVQEPTVLLRLNGTVYQPGTNLVPGIRPWLLFFARSNRNRIKLIPTNDKVHASDEWFVNGQPGGSTIQYPDDGVLTITAYARPVSGVTINDVGTSGGHVRLLRNGREMYSFDNWDLNFTREFRIPFPKDTVDQYSLELENNCGGHFTTMPVYVTANTRPGTVRLPILHDGKVIEIDFAADRIPYFHYRFDRNRGLLASDLSGYEHNGYIGGKGYNAGQLQQTGFRYEHTGPVPNTAPSDPKFINEEGGFLRFGGQGYIKLMGGTMPPYASTVEMVFRARKLGNYGLFGTANNSLQLFLSENGHVEAQRGLVKVISHRTIKAGEWVRVAVIYDMRKMTLYLDSIQDASLAIPPCADYEWFNSAVVGAIGTHPYSDPQNNFDGDIAELRIYGRNLNPSEFIK